MKFCAVLRNHPEDRPGGAEYQSHLICEELAARGFETHYVAHRASTERVDESEGVMIHRCTGGGRSIIEKLRMIDADVYYFRLFPDLPLLYRARRTIDAMFTYNISRSVQCAPLFTGGVRSDTNLIGSALEKVQYGTYRFLLKTPDLVFAQTAEQQHMLEQYHGLDAKVVGNGHPVPERACSKTSPKVVLWLGNLKAVKRPQDFIRVVESIHNTDIRFWIVGRPVDSEVHKYVERRARKIPSLEYHGGCDIDECNAYFQQASLFVHTGVAEGFPNTFIQSWLHEVPVISLDTDPDRVLEVKSIGYHSESIDDAAVRVMELSDQDKKRARMGRAARSYAIEHHDMKVVVDRLLTHLKIYFQSRT